MFHQPGGQARARPASKVNVHVGNGLARVATVIDHEAEAGVQHAELPGHLAGGEQEISEHLRDRSATASPTRGMQRLGTISTWTGACGSTSRKASTSSVSWTMSVGIWRTAIFSKRVMGKEGLSLQAPAERSETAAQEKFSPSGNLQGRSRNGGKHRKEGEVGIKEERQPSFFPFSGLP